MAPKVFYSFHFDGDCWRTQQVRHIGSIDGSEPVSPQRWEEVKGGGDATIERWIESELSGKSCLVVLVGAETAQRKWVKHEIKRAWELKKGVVAIRVHNLKDQQRATSAKGANPLAAWKFDGMPLSDIAKIYDPPAADAYKWISDNIVAAVEEAVQIRKEH